MAPVTEFARFVPKEEHKSDIEALLAANAATFKQPGVEGIQSSPALEADNPLYLLTVDWASLEAHQAWTASRNEDFAAFRQQLTPLLADKPKIYHVAFSPAHPPVLHNGAEGAKSKVAEIIHLYFPAGDAFTPDQLAATAEGYQSFLSHLPGNAAGHTGEAAGGWAIEELEYKGEKARAFVVAIGWDSVEAHLEYRKTEHFAKTIPIVRNLEGLKGTEVFHVSTKPL